MRNKRVSDFSILESLVQHKKILINIVVRHLDLLKAIGLGSKIKIEQSRS